MKFMAVRDLRNKPGDVWESLKTEREIVLTSNGQPVALMTAVTGDDLELQLKTIRRARALGALERIQSAAVEKGLDSTPPGEIEKVISKSRKSAKTGAKRPGKAASRQ